ncbi:hypothetical protein BV25DRAFT_993268 [Artomyces pyxidatus]|uniref:Uncharacterized protein n=1 Tax=Artomyces pyxidatus TaxID=48021 RepID=A0ACB8STS8_9AGAM|nr:hypothetical protein BV25DRAFT_993268 [Artomyces pyxidatus]
MPPSLASSDPLSSPSPTPPPPPVPIPGPAIAPAPTKQDNEDDDEPMALDTSSDLSELTEEEQDADKQPPCDDDGDDDPEDDDDNDEDRDEGGRTTATRGHKKRRSLVPEQMWDWAYKSKKDGKSKVVEEEEEEEEEQAGPPKAMEEEEDDEEDVPGHHRTHKRAPRVEVEERVARAEADETTPGRRRPARDVDEEESLSNESADEPDEDEDDDSQVEDMDVDEGEDEIPTPPPKPVEAAKENSPDLTEDEAPPADAPESDDETASEDDMDDAADVPPVPAPALTPAAAVLPTPTVNGIATVDVTAPPPAIIAPVAIAAAASSIMAGSAVLGPPSPTSSASGSPSSSRSASPVADEDDEAKAAEENGPEEVEPVEAIAEDEPVEEVDDEGEGEADVEMDVEAEAELQPAHRAEALDVLATIELKFALLRERVYVEKMEALAWEEALVADDTHPEMMHLHTELAKRRGKRLELAERRRSYEVANSLKRRRASEDAVWSWWMHARDDLQIDMIAETNRKRRKLERDRRTAERPQPRASLPTCSVSLLIYAYTAQRIPNFQHEVPVAPTLYDIVNNNPYVPSASTNRQPKDSAPRAYPTLSTLSNVEVSGDLDYIFSNRRLYEPHRPPVQPHGYDNGYVGGAMLEPPPRMPGYPSSRRGVPGPSGLQQELEREAGMPGMGMPPHVGGYPMASREISPVHVSSGPKVNGWMAGGPVKGGPEWAREMRRGEPGEEEYMREREERERERGNMLEIERERERARERHDRERDRERGLDLQYQQQQQQQGHPRTAHHMHGHVGPGLPPHHQSIGPHHHHHFHHVHHHHHPPSGPVNGTPMSPLPGPASYSGHSPRIMPTRDHSGPPTTEIINLSSTLPSRHPGGPGPSPHWRVDERERELPLSPRYARERGRPASGPPPVGPHERIMTPFSMTPTHQPASIGGRHAASAGPSRRGSFSADGPPLMPGGAVMGGVGSSPARGRRSPPQGFAGVSMSPPRNRLPPPASPSAPRSRRSSPRMGAIALPPFPPGPVQSPEYMKASVGASPGTKPQLPPPKMMILDGMQRAGTPSGEAHGRVTMSPTLSLPPPPSVHRMPSQHLGAGPHPHGPPDGVLPPPPPVPIAAGEA